MLRNALLCCALAGLCGVLVAVILFLDSATRAMDALPGILDANLKTLTAGTAHAEHDAVAGIVGQLAAARKDLGHAETSLVSTSSDVAALAIESMDDQFTKTNATLASGIDQVGSSLRELAAIRQDIQPSIEGANLLMRRDALPAQVLGLTAAAKVTFGQAAETAREIQRATPAMIQGLDRLVMNSDRTTEATARVMDNLATVSKPLPRWWRIGAGIAIPAAEGAAAGSAIHSALK